MQGIDSLGGPKDVVRISDASFKRDYHTGTRIGYEPRLRRYFLRKLSVALLAARYDHSTATHPETPRSPSVAYPAHSL